MKRKPYVTPSIVPIGRITVLTGHNRNQDYLDNTNGSDAWMRYDETED